jgi:hypothetical protein
MAKWRDCGYLGYTRAHDKILIVLKNEHYVADLGEIREVLDGKRDYTLIFEPPPKEEKKQ